MATLQDQYISAVRQSQDTWVGVVDTFTEGLQKSFALPGATPFDVVDPSAAIDQVFDFWGKTLEVQRDVSKQFAGLTLAVAEKARTQAESVGAAVREQAESAVRAVREQAAHKYADLTKAELQDELDRRNLPKTGNVDELRARLVEDDHKSV